jgi:ATP-dependent Lhr-like helicase
MRFLVKWHGLDAPGGELEQALASLEGWCAPVVAWEDQLLKRRCPDYDPLMLDRQFLGGALTWFRPRMNSSEQVQLVSATPIAMVPRGKLHHWQPLEHQEAGSDLPLDELPSPNEATEAVLELMHKHGAMFSDDIASRAGLLPTQLESVLATLVARGLVTADAFSPLRWLIRTTAEKTRIERRMRRSRSRQTMARTASLGRWSPVASQPEPERRFAQQERLGTICQALLRRYGVVFRATLQRESLLPPWRELLAHLRRMEDRGEVNGGRFVDGFSGEQFALPEAVGLLRRSRKEDSDSPFVVINAADPLNLGGIMTPGVKTPARVSNLILLENGVPAARWLGGELEMLNGSSREASAAAQSYFRAGLPRLPAQLAGGAVSQPLNPVS